MNAGNRLPNAGNTCRLLMGLAILLMTIATSTATVPEAPLDLVVRDASSPNTPDRMIELSWRANPQGAVPDGYMIYMAQAENGAAGDFRAITRTTETSHLLQNMGLGLYVFQVTAFNADGEGRASEMAKIAFGGGPDPTNAISFTTAPEREAQIGVPYRYDADAVDPNGGAVRYAIEEAPLGAPFPFAEGMTVNATTGVVEWTPQRSGVFAAALIARLESDTTQNAMQVLILNVVEPPCATIRGTVINANGTVIERAYVAAITPDGNNGTPWNTGASAEVINGEYALSVPNGTYVLYLKHPMAGLVWYKDAGDISGAERIVVVCGDAVQADFVVVAPPEPTRFTVSGRVTAQSDGGGVMATVQFMMRDRNGSNTDPATGGFYPGDLSVKTDPDGFYTIELTDQYAYIAQAIPENEDLLTQFYNRVSNPTEATPITAQANSFSVDFSLASRPVYDNGIGGRVTDATGIAVPSQVIAIRIARDNNTPDPTGRGDFARATMTESDGAFTLRNLVPGDYVVLAIPADREHTPGYYVLGGGASLGWADATRITLDETTFSSSTGIILGPRDGKRGFARLGGYVKVLPGSTKSNRDLLGADPLPGVFVYALDTDGRVGDYTFSDASGWFQLIELGAGDYQIIADKVGYTSQVITTNLDYNGRASVDQDISMSKGTSGVDDAVAGTGGLALYPNPVDSRLTLSFEARAGDASLTIIDPLGRTISVTSIDLVDGANSAVVDIATLRPGCYRAQLQAAGINRSVPFIVAR